MADNYLENHYEEYLVRKAAWQQGRKSLKNVKPRRPERPDDEAL